MPASKCPSCGEWVTDWMTTCLSCGYVLQPAPPQAPPQAAPPDQPPPPYAQPPAQPYAQPPAQPPPAQPWPQQPWPQQYAAGSAPPPRRRRRRLWVALAGVLAVLLVVGGVLVVVLRGGDDHPAAHKGSLRPVTSRPTQRWEWSSGKDIESVSATSDFVVATLADGAGIAVLDSSGKELWRNDSEKYDAAYVYDDDKVIVASFYDSQKSKSGSVVFDYDGNVLWRSGDDAYYDGKQDDGSYLISDDAHYKSIDPATGKVHWSIASGDGSTTTKDRILTVAGDTVTSYSRQDGSRQWTATLPAGNRTGMKEKYDVEAAANDSFVLVSTGTLTAFDIDTGKQLWTGGSGGSLTALAGSRVLVVPHYYYDEGEKQPKGPFPFYGVAGRAGTLDVPAKDGYASVFPEKVQGTERNVSYEDGRVFDENGTLVMSGSPDLYTNLGDGYYTLAGSTIGYRTWGEDRAVWSLTLDDVDSLKDDYDGHSYDIGIDTLDRALIVHDKRTIWRYE